MLLGLTLLTFTLLYLSTHPAIIWGAELKPAPVSPMIYNKPFTVVWNTPTANCKTKFGVDLDLSSFDIIENENGHFIGEKITIFYNSKLGLYPYYTEEGIPVNGGLVQNASLPKHLEIAMVNITSLMDQDFRGLAVVDWEKWRPFWVRNWGKLDIYRKKSAELERSKNPDLPESEILQIAKKNFETAAQNFMRQTLKVGQMLRPKGCWGFYKFPECYNYFKENTETDYTGPCTTEDIPRNNQLAWLWKVSQCLYPSIYIPKELKSSNNVPKFVHHRIKEALRVAALDPDSDVLPVLAYSKYSYKKTFEFLTEIDLVHTIGESAAMGAAGVVLWGNMDFARTKERCETLKDYIDRQLGRYILNVTAATTLCSTILCNGRGRCVRKDLESKTYLHLDAKAHKFIPVHTSTGSRWEAHGEFSSETLNSLKSQFKCQCTKAWLGYHCDIGSNL